MSNHKTHKITPAILTQLVASLSRRAHSIYIYVLSVVIVHTCGFSVVEASVVGSHRVMNIL